MTATEGSRTAQDQASGGRPVFLSYVHSFRALAIIIIVAGHAIVTLAWNDQPRVRDFLLDLLDNGTVLFVFVAGFLFHHLAGNYRYRNYLGKKLRFVIVPYLLLSIPAIFYSVLWLNPVDRFPELAGTSTAYQVFWHLIKGGATINYSLWFIPMIALFYLAAPLLIQFVRFPRLYLVLLALVPLSMLLHRNAEIDTGWIALYYLPAYIAGMWASHQRERLEPLLSRYAYWLVGAYLAVVLAQFLFAAHHGNYYGLAPFSQEKGLVDWQFGQKLLLCFALLGLMKRLESTVGARLTFIGDISFTIFFVNVYVLFVFLVGYVHTVGRNPEGSVLSWLALSVGTVAITVGATALAKRLLGRYSRTVIGS